MGITISAGWYQQATNSPADVEAAERAIQMRVSIIIVIFVCYFQGWD